MIKRRELLVGAAVVSVAPRPRRLTASFGFRNCVAHLEGADVGVLTGIPAKALHPTPRATVKALSVRVQGTTGLVKWQDSPEVRLEFMNGGEGFVAAYVPPVDWHGYVGYDPTLDLPTILEGGDGEFWNFPADAVGLPLSLRTARAVNVTLLGQLDSFMQVQHVMERIQTVVPQDAHLLFTANDDEHLPLAALISIFGTSR